VSGCSVLSTLGAWSGATRRPVTVAVGMGVVTGVAVTDVGECGGGGVVGCRS
jgi:hypothetical protein